MSKFWRRVRLNVLLWIDRLAMHIANRCDIVSSWCYYHAFTTKEERNADRR